MPPKTAEKPTTDYTLIATGPWRPFEITGGLLEGYERNSARTHVLDDVLRAHHDWQAQSRIVLGVFVHAATCSYGFPNGDGIRSMSEPGFILSGTINVLYQAEWSATQCLNAVLSLASFLARALGQTRIYASFDGSAYVLEKPESEVAASSL